MTRANRRAQARAFRLRSTPPRPHRATELRAQATELRARFVDRYTPVGAPIDDHVWEASQALPEPNRLDALAAALERKAGPAAQRATALILWHRALTEPERADLFAAVAVSTASAVQSDDDRRAADHATRTGHALVAVVLATLAVALWSSLKPPTQAAPSDSQPEPGPLHPRAQVTNLCAAPGAPNPQDTLLRS